MILNNTGPINHRLHEIGFLVLLLMMVLIEFILFYFAIPQLTQSSPSAPEMAITEESGF